MIVSILVSFSQKKQRRDDNKVQKLCPSGRDNRINGCQVQLCYCHRITRGFRWFHRFRFAEVSIWRARFYCEGARGCRKRFRCLLRRRGRVSGADADKMSKLQVLNAFLTERLAALVREVVQEVVQEVEEAVEEALGQYRDQTARTRRENRSLRRQLRDFLPPGDVTERPSKAPGSAGRAGGSDVVPVNWLVRAEVTSSL